MIRVVGLQRELLFASAPSMHGPSGCDDALSGWNRPGLPFHSVLATQIFKPVSVYISDQLGVNEFGSGR
jgi:hypothetical protein